MHFSNLSFATLAVGTAILSTLMPALAAPAHGAGRPSRTSAKARDAATTASASATTDISQSNPMTKLMAFWNVPPLPSRGVTASISLGFHASNGSSLEVLMKNDGFDSAWTLVATFDEKQSPTSSLAPGTEVLGFVSRGGSNADGTFNFQAGFFGTGAVVSRNSSLLFDTASITYDVDFTDSFDNTTFSRIAITLADGTAPEAMWNLESSGSSGQQVDQRQTSTLGLGSDLFHANEDLPS